MESVSNVVRVHLPGYLSSLPVPKTLLGWFSLSLGDWVRLVPFGVAVGGLSYLSLHGLCQAPTIGPILQVRKGKF